MTILPLCLVLSLPYLRGTSDRSQDMAGSPRSWDAEIDATLKPSAQDDVKLAIASRSRPAADVSASKSSKLSKPVSPQETRVAMRSDSKTALPFDTPKVTTKEAGRRMTESAVERPVVSDMAAALPIPVENISSDETVPVPYDTTSKTAADTVAAQSDLDTMVSSAGISEDEAAVDLEKAVLNQEMDTALAQQKTPSGPTYFDSTGHLALLSPAAEASPPPRAAQDTTPDGTRSRNARRADSSALKTPEVRSDPFATATRGNSETWIGDQGDSGTKLPDVLEEVILQQPLESRRVNQVESVVAVTRAKGWPIALVRSDLPDDYWWVQQMVGIRGNAFAARVNFGNNESIPGSVYHLVIVFLDSPDEVRRFRIAKQFKDLPEGVRHSREYTFVRQ
ncbi:MAG: hypothetical protein R3C59_25935 [Planctomycetaceae bacterium]